MRRRFFHGALSALVVLMAASGIARAGTPENTAFRQANKLYARGKYEKARVTYERLVKKGIRNEDLYYNLGNTYYRLEQLGRAIWAYEKALRVDPRHREAKHNLGIAREAVAAKVKDKVVGARRASFTMRVVRAFSTSSATIWFLLVWYLVFGSIIAAVVVGRGVVRAALSAVAGLMGAVAIVFGLILYNRVDLERNTRHAIVLEDKVPVREGPRGVATEAFKIHAGLRVQITVREDRWTKIRLANGLEGWVRAGTIGEL